MMGIKKDYFKLLLSAFLCFSNSLSAIHAEEKIPGEDLTEDVMVSEDTPEPEQAEESEGQPEEITESAQEESEEVSDEEQPEIIYGEEVTEEVTVPEEEEKETEAAAEENPDDVTEGDEKEEPGSEESAEETADEAEEFGTGKAEKENDISAGSASADSSSKGTVYTYGQFTYELNDEGKITLKEYDASNNPTSVTIPNTIRNNGTYIAVTEIGDYCFLRCSSLTTIRFMEGSYVKRIGTGAFSETGITSMTLPESVTEIGAQAFRRCSSLASVTIPGSVTSMGNNVFTDCNNIVTAGPIGTGSSIEFGWTSVIPDYAFNDCESLLSATIPNGITKIGYKAFAFCYNLASVTIPASVTNIDDNSFQYCSSLTGISLPTGLTNIGWEAFSYCSSLTSIVIPEGVTSIGGQTFSYCDHLKNITIPNGVTDIGSSAFSGCSSLETAAIPASVTYISNNAFSNCSSLTTVSGLGRVTSIGEYAFYNCSSLTSITLPDSLITIGRYGFYGCSSLSTILIPDSLTSIGQFAFFNCSRLVTAGPAGSDANIQIEFTDTIPGFYSGYQNGSYETGGLFYYLQKITIPDTVTSIGNMAFYCCSKLSDVTIPDSVTSIGTWAFYNCKSLAAITLPDHLTAIETRTFSDCENLTAVVIPDGVTSIASAAFNECSGLESITVPASVTSIDDSAFYNCSKLKTAGPIGSDTNIQIEFGEEIPGIYTSYPLLNANYGLFSFLEEIIIPDTVRRIGDNAFALSRNLRNITLPDGVTSIGKDAFYYCYLLRSIVIPDSVSSIGERAFYGCSYLTDISIPDGVISIGDSTFYSCKNLASVTIPATVTDISAKAFYGCSGLTDVYFRGTEDQWNRIIVGEENDALYGATIHFDSCHDGHKWMTPSYTWEETGDGYDVFAEAVCENDPSHTVTETAHAYSTVIQPATCENEGTEIYTAEFENEPFDTQTKEETIAAIGHHYGTPSYEWTETEDGYTVTARAVCETDSTHVLTETAAANLAVSAEPGCEETGTGLYTAVFENELFTTQTKEAEIPATGHHYGEPSYEWTETEDGYSVTAKAVCENDSSHVLTETVTAGYTVIEEPDCEETGKGLHTAVFENALFSTQTKESVIPAAGHAYVFDFINWTGNDASGYTAARAYYTCANNEDHIKVKSLNVTSETTAPGCEQPGQTVYTASVNAEESPDGIEHTETKTVIIPAAGHDYGTPSYEWTETEDGYTVTARAVCKTDSSHVLTETVDAVLVVIVKPTFVTTGEGRYAAVFSSDVFTAQTKEGIIIPVRTETDPDDLSYTENTDNTITVTGYSGSDDTVILPAKISGKEISEIGDGAFAGNTAITGIVVPEGVTAIGDNAFNGCTGLKTVVIPGSVTSIGEGAFSGCDGLEYIYFGGTAEEWEALNADPGNAAVVDIDTQNTVNDLMGRIETIGTVTLDNADEIAEMYAAYNELDDAYKGLVTNYYVLESAEQTAGVLVKIAGLSREITLDDKDSVEEARKAYEALTDEQKALVTNLDVLENAETVIEKLETDKDAADAVISLINALSDELTLDDRESVEEARAAYDALTDDQKALIENYDVLTAAERSIEKMVKDKEAADAVTAQIAELPEMITLEDRAAVEAARTAYEALTDDQKALVSNYDILTAAEESIAVQEEQSWGDIIEEDRHPFKDAAEVPAGIWVAGIKNQTYAGSAIRPDFRVYDGKTLLKNKTDYTVTYKNTTKAYHVEDPANPTAADKKKAPQVTVKANTKGNYKGSRTVYFSIDPVDLNDEQITVDELSVHATGKTLSPVPTVYFNGKKLKAKTDYTVDYNGWDQKTHGDHEIIVKGKGNFDGIRKIDIKVVPAGNTAVSKLTVTARTLKYADLTEENFEAKVKEAITVKQGKTVLTLDDDYAITGIYPEQRAVGSFKVTLVGNEDNNLAGRRTVTVKITGTSIKDKKVNVNKPTYSYTGTEIPLGEDFTISYGTILLEKDKDYRILEDTYKNNVNSGTASVTIEGINGYTGTRTVSYLIRADKASLTEDYVQMEDTFEYVKGGVKPEPVIPGLKKGTDYTLTYKNNTKVGTGTVTVAFKGNYKGVPTITKQFSITQKDINDTSLTVKDIVLNSKAGKYRSTPAVKDTNGKTLKANTDYTVSYYLGEQELSASDKITEAETVITVKVSGINNYSGEKTETYRILNTGKDISKATFKITPQEYTGSAVTLEKEDITSAKIGKTTVLNYSTDYVIESYTNNINKGTAKVTFRGVGDYGGTKTVSFKIGQRSIVTYWNGVRKLFGNLF